MTTDSVLEATHFSKLCHNTASTLEYNNSFCGIQQFGQIYCLHDRDAHGTGRGVGNQALYINHCTVQESCVLIRSRCLLVGKRS